MTTMTPIPPSVQRFERVLRAGLKEAGLDFWSFKPKQLESKVIRQQLREAGIPEDRLTGPAMAIRQIAWSEDESDRDIVMGFMSTVVIFQEVAIWLPDYERLSDPFFGDVQEFNNEHTPEVFAARLLVHMIKGDPMYPPGKTPVMDDDGNVSYPGREDS